MYINKPINPDDNIDLYNGNVILFSEKHYLGRRSIFDVRKLKINNNMVEINVESLRVSNGLQVYFNNDHSKAYTQNNPKIKKNICQYYGDKEKDYTRRGNV